VVSGEVRKNKLYQHLTGHAPPPNDANASRRSCDGRARIAGNRSGEAGFYALIIVAEQARPGAQAAAESADAEPNRASELPSRDARNRTLGRLGAAFAEQVFVAVFN